MKHSSLETNSRLEFLAQNDRGCRFDSWRCLPDMLFWVHCDWSGPFNDWQRIELTQFISQQNSIAEYGRHKLMPKFAREVIRSSPSNMVWNFKTKNFTQCHDGQLGMQLRTGWHSLNSNKIMSSMFLLLGSDWISSPAWCQDEIVGQRGSQTSLDFSNMIWNMYIQWRI